MFVFATKAVKRVLNELYATRTLKSLKIRSIVSEGLLKSCGGRGFVRSHFLRRLVKQSVCVFRFAVHCGLRSVTYNVIRVIINV